ncbi:MAG: DUF1080 domain-containing protein [Chitinophagaceae bacterium]
MKYLLSSLAFSALLMLASCSSAQKTGAKEKGFVQIFDGKSLKGWEGDLTYWRVENGHLVGEITPATLLKRNQFIIWKGGVTTDFELTLDCKITSGGNSGVNYRSEELKDLQYAMKGYQADIDGANHYTGQNYEERGRTTLAYRGQKTIIKPLAGNAPLSAHIKNNAWTELTVTGSLGSSDSLKNLIKSEDWNKVRIIARGNRLQHFINGVLMSEVIDEDTVNGKSTGQLGVQVHVGPPMKVEFRNIMFKKL